jgi:hypothetical protein
MMSLAPLSRAGFMAPSFTPTCGETTAGGGVFTSCIAGRVYDATKAAATPPNDANCCKAAGTSKLVLAMDPWAERGGGLTPKVAVSGVLRWPLAQGEAMAFTINAEAGSGFPVKIEVQEDYSISVRITNDYMHRICPEILRCPAQRGCSQ